MLVDCSCGGPGNGCAQCNGAGWFLAPNQPDKDWTPIPRPDGTLYLDHSGKRVAFIEKPGRTWVGSTGKQ